MITEDLRSANTKSIRLGLIFRYRLGLASFSESPSPASTPRSETTKLGLLYNRINDCDCTMNPLQQFRVFANLFKLPEKTYDTILATRGFAAR